MQGQLFIQLQQTLGEGVIWHQHEQKVYWTDILNGVVYRANVDGSALEERQVPFHIGCMTIQQNGKLILCASTGIYDYQFDTNTYEQVVSAFTLPENLRCNDGKISPDGELWFGTMAYEPNTKEGSLYRLLSTKELVVEKDEVTIPNGIAWTENYLYFVDSGDRTLYKVAKVDGQYDWKNATVLFTPENENVTPDGMTMDAEGNLWIALWGGGKVICLNPDTVEISDEILIPAPYVTSCAFAGEDLHTLVITTAISDLTDEQKEQYPLAGSMFVANVQAKGQLSHIFKGELV